MLVNIEMERNVEGTGRLLPRALAIRDWDKVAINLSIFGAMAEIQTGYSRRIAAGASVSG
jgi:hypothetical protein